MNDREDDAIDDLRAFNADVARLSADARERMRRTVLDGVGPVRPARPVLALAPARSATAPRRSHRRRATVLGLAAAVLVVMALVGVSGGHREEGPPVALGPAATETGAVPEALVEVAARAAARPDERLGVGDARYAHRVVIIDGPYRTGRPNISYTMETWVDIDGTGRVISDPSGSGRRQDQLMTQSDSLLLGGLPPRAVARLPVEVSALVARLRDVLGGGDEVTDADLVEGIVDLLAEAGVPAPVRSALFRALDRVGLRPDRFDHADRGSAYVIGAGGGSTLRVVLDADTVPVLVETIDRDGDPVKRSYSGVDLRSDLHSR